MITETHQNSIDSAAPMSCPPLHNSVKIDKPRKLKKWEALSHEQRMKWIEFYLSGVPTTKIFDIGGPSATILRRWMNDMGMGGQWGREVKFRKSCIKEPKLVQEAIEAYGLGVPVCQIAEQLKISVSSLYKILRTHNIRMRKEAYGAQENNDIA